MKENFSIPLEYESVIVKAWEKNFGYSPAVNSLVIAGIGRRNIAILIGDKIIRLPHIEISKGYERYTREQLVVSMLSSNTKIPVPNIKDVGIIDELPYMIYNKLPGNEIQYPYIKEGTYSLGKQLGVFLSQVHQIKLSGYGLLNYKGQGNYHNLDQEIAEALERGWNYLLVTEYMTTQQVRLLQYLIQSRIHTLGAESCLITNDLTQGNILINSEGKITGLIDFELAEANPPLKDLAKIKYLEESIPGVYKDFGYTYRNGDMTINNTLQAQLSLYELIIRITKVFQIDDITCPIYGCTTPEEKAKVLLGKIWLLKESLQQDK